MIMNRKLRWISLALVLAATGCAKKERTRVYVLNGLDIPVHVDIQSDGGGDHASFEIAPHGRETPDASGLSTVKVTTAKGDLISEGKAQFGKPKGCLRIYNVVGAAAYVAEDVVYGSGFGTPQRMPRAGEISEEECDVSFPFVEPSKETTVDHYGPRGTNLRWLHYDGDGGWMVAVRSLLDDNGPNASFSHGAVQRIVAAVVTHDPSNPALPEVKARLEKMGLAFPVAHPGNLLSDR
jgi:hypothetical protein